MGSGISTQEELSYRTVRVLLKNPFPNSHLKKSCWSSLELNTRVRVTEPLVPAEDNEVVIR